MPDQSLGMSKRHNCPSRGGYFSLSSGERVRGNGCPDLEVGSVKFHAAPNPGSLRYVPVGMNGGIGQSSVSAIARSSSASIS